MQTSNSTVYLFVTNVLKILTIILGKKIYGVCHRPSIFFSICEVRHLGILLVLWKSSICSHLVSSRSLWENIRIRCSKDCFFLFGCAICNRLSTIFFVCIWNLKSFFLFIGCKLIFRRLENFALLCLLGYVLRYIRRMIFGVFSEGWHERDLGFVVWVEDISEVVYISWWGGKYLVYVFY